MFVVRYSPCFLSFDVPLWVKNNPSESDKQKAAQSGAPLKIAGSGSGERKDEGIGVMMSMDKDESTQRMERDAEAAAKRQQNALPAWHLRSTISGDLTALGIIENSRTETTSTGSSTLNDDVLRGLGVVGAARKEPIPATVIEDFKPVVIHGSDCMSLWRTFLVIHTVLTNLLAQDYDQYYASLAASSVPSTHNTPSGFGASGSDDSGEFMDNEEEDRKPSIEYLDSLNDYRKRSRSREDEGSAKKKVVKTGETNGYAYSLGAELTDKSDAIMVAEVTPEDDPIVHGKFLFSYRGELVHCSALISERDPNTFLKSHRGRPRPDDSRRIHGVFRGLPVAGVICMNRTDDLVHGKPFVWNFVFGSWSPAAERSMANSSTCLLHCEISDSSHRA